MSERIASRLLIVGWDAADWKIIDPLLKAGALPTLQRLLATGARGDLSSLDPKLSPLLWTSIATGKTADKHGILNFVEPDPAGSLRISASTTRKTKALWNILTQAGLKTNVVGWYASHPAEPISGVVVTNLFQEGAPQRPGDPWPLARGVVHPTSWAERIAEVRLHSGELMGDELLALLPGLRTMNHADPRVQRVARLVAQCASIHNAATAILGSPEPWDCTMVFHEAIDVAGHHFMQYYPPRMAHVSPADFEAFRHVIPGIYHLLDAMLGVLLELAGSQTTLILVSDHGFHSDHLRPRVQAALDDPHAAMDASWHRPLGVVTLAGQGIKSGPIYGASLLDITPTALTLLGQPVGADMDGRVLVEAIDAPAPIDRIFSWDDLPGEAGLHPPDLRVDPLESRDAMQQLADLGYITAPSADVAAQVALCDRETRFNLGVVYMTTSRPRQAIPLFERLTREHPRDPRFALNLAHCLLKVGRYAEAIAAMESLLVQLPDFPDAHLVRGAALFSQGRVEEAAVALEAAARQCPDRPDLMCSVADAYIHLKRWEQAEAVLSHAAAIDPHDPVVHEKLARLALARERFEDAADHALRALELKHFFPEAHYTLGVALTWMKDYDHAIQSFKVAVSMQPGMIDAHRYIASIYRHLDDRRSARPFRDATERLLHARAQGEVAPESLIRNAPLGPQEWAKRMAIPESDD
jgi:tetratricopeptide (TPR) repeat protein